MKHMLMVTVDVDSDDELVDAIDRIMETPGVSRWTADVLSPHVLRELSDRGHAITQHKTARTWTAVAERTVPRHGRRARPL